MCTDQLETKYRYLSLVTISHETANCTPHRIPVHIIDMYLYVCICCSAPASSGVSLDELLKELSSRVDDRRRPLTIRRTAVWKSFTRAIKHEPLVSCGIDVKFTDSLGTVDDGGPRRQLLCLLRKVLITNRSLFLETGKPGHFVLAHNTDALTGRHFYCVGQALSAMIVLGGQPPQFLANALYTTLTRGFHAVNPTLLDVPNCGYRSMIQEVGRFSLTI